MKSVLLLIFVFPWLASAAGIRVVGNGVGFGEMQALSAFSRMKSFVVPCLFTSNPCQLTAEEQARLNELITSGQLDPQNVELGFFSCTRGIETCSRLEGHRWLLGSQIFYDSNQVPLPFNEIAKRVFVLWVDRSEGSSWTNREPQTALANKIFSQVTMTNLFQWNLPQSNGIGRILRISTLTNSDFLFSVEFEHQTVELTVQLKDSIPCGSGASDFDISHLYVESGVLNATGKWRCSGETVSARLVIQFSDVKSPDRFAESVRFRWLGLNRISSCSQALTVRRF